MYADVVYELTPRGDVVWRWHAWEHLDPNRHIIAPHDRRSEWSHGNTVGELADGNIILSFRHISTVVIVEKQTGRIIWEVGDDVLAQQHYPNELPNGNILVFDNGTFRNDRGGSFSHVLEIDRRTRDVVWQYQDDPFFGFYSSHISSAQRLPNGNTMITEGWTGRLFEITPEGEVVWEYVNPYFGPMNPAQPATLPGRGESNNVFRAFRYAPEELSKLRV